MLAASGVNVGFRATIVLVCGAAFGAALFIPSDVARWLLAATILRVPVVVHLPRAATWAAFDAAMQRHLQSPRRSKVFNLLMASLPVGTAIVLRLR